MGLHAHLRDGVPMAMIPRVGCILGGYFWVESGGLLNPSLRDKKRHTFVCKGSAVGGRACKATPEAPVLFYTRALHAPLPWEGQHDGAWFFIVQGGCCIARLLGGSSLWTLVLGCPMCSNPST